MAAYLANTHLRIYSVFFYLKLHEGTLNQGRLLNDLCYGLVMPDNKRASHHSVWALILDDRSSLIATCLLEQTSLPELVHCAHTHTHTHTPSPLLWRWAVSLYFLILRSQCKHYSFETFSVLLWFYCFEQTP